MIKRIIDDSDYYLVIVGGRYGSLGPDGLSYTEMEYRYAKKIGKPIIVFLHNNPGSIPADKTEFSEDGRKRLDAFRTLVQEKICKKRKDSSDLGSQVSRSIINLKTNSPAVGWVRANHIDEKGLQEIVEYRRKIDALEAEIKALRVDVPEGIEGLAQGADIFEAEFDYCVSSSAEWESYLQRFDSSILISWNQIFSVLAPNMLRDAPERVIIDAFNKYIEMDTRGRLAASHAMRRNIQLSDFSVHKPFFQTILIQLRSLGLIEATNGDGWILTKYGDVLMGRLKAVHKDELVRVTE